MIIKVILFLSLAVLFGSCEQRVTGARLPDVYTNLVERNEVILTSNSNQNFLLLLKPIDVEVVNGSNYPIADINFYIYECVNSLERPKYIPIHIKDDYYSIFTIHDITDKFFPNKKSTIRLYRRMYIYPQQDSSGIFEKELQYIKRNSTSDNRFHNDSIRYSNFQEFKKKYYRYFQNRSIDECEILKTTFFLMDSSYSKHVNTYELKW